MPFVTFGELPEGTFFVARGGTFFVKEQLTLFHKSLDTGGKSMNAFYYQDSVGKFVHFEEITLVQVYNKDLHGNSTEIIRLQERRIKKDSK